MCGPNGLCCQSSLINSVGMQANLELSTHKDTHLKKLSLLHKVGNFLPFLGKIPDYCTEKKINMFI